MIASIFLGMLPEVIYFTLFLIYTKDIKDKKFRLFLGIAISYLICILLAPYKILYYILFTVLIYIVLKILYRKKTQIVDFFVIMYALTYVVILSYLIYFAKDFTSYLICYCIERVLLFSIFIFRKHFNKWYKKYCKYWNRDDTIKRPVKSITLRTISLVILNCIIPIMSVICVYVIDLTVK